MHERDECQRELVDRVRGRLLFAEIMVNLRKLDLPGFDPARTKQFLASAERAMAEHELGYAVGLAKKSSW